MWQLNDQTPYASERNWIRDTQGMHHWIVAIRSTYDLGPGGPPSLAEQQLAPVLAPEYFGEPGESSLRYDSDLLAIKPNTDVLFHGSAHAPRGRPSPTVEVILHVGSIDKRLVVHGERVYYNGSAWVGRGIKPDEHGRNAPHISSRGESRRAQHTPPA